MKTSTALVGVPSVARFVRLVTALPNQAPVATITSPTGNVTVNPGDLVFGDREGVYFVPPSLVQTILDQADVTHIHDEWTRKKFDEGKYKSRDIYGTPSDPALKQEYDAYLKRRLEELRKERGQ